jgi:hypothetical protein
MSDKKENWNVVKRADGPPHVSLNRIKQTNIGKNKAKSSEIALIR